MTQTAPARRLLVGNALRRYREHLGWPLDEAARILECDRSKISRVETGQRGIRPKELRELLTDYGVAEPERNILSAIANPRAAHGWWQDYADILTPGQLDLLAIESIASHIMTYDPQHVPDLLRTPDYARAIAPAAAAPGAPDRIAEFTKTRQKTLIDERRPAITAVIGEAALQRKTGGARTMRAQLQRLARIGVTCPWVTVQILPFSADTHPASGPMTILRFPEAPGLGLVHLPILSGLCLVDQHHITSHVTTFTQLQLAALSAADTVALLSRNAARR
jgi:transcriptional regulator with XRE-family HTH domain